MTTTEPTTLAAIRAALEKMTPGPYRLIWHGNEKDEGLGYPLSIETADGAYWIARDGKVSTPENAHAIALLLNHGPALVEFVMDIEKDRSNRRIAASLDKLNAALDGDGGGRC